MVTVRFMLVSCRNPKNPNSYQIEKCGPLNQNWSKFNLLPFVNAQNQKSNFNKILTKRSHHIF